MKFNKITVLTGTFRCFHHGHIYLIARAYNLGLPVYVLLNSDQGTKALGKSVSDSYVTRKRKLLKTGLVKKVLWFHTNQRKWLQILKPTFFVMGGDHNIKELSDKGREFINKVHVVKRLPGYSSEKELEK